MTANPALVQTYTGELVPAPFANELFVLKRPKVGFELDGVQTRTGKYVLLKMEDTYHNIKTCAATNLTFMHVAFCAGGLRPVLCIYLMLGWCLLLKSLMHQVTGNVSAAALGNTQIHTANSQCCQPNASCLAGLAGFDMPLVYISKEKLNQPIFGCNNLAGNW